jgi:hypothetical protein
VKDGKTTDANGNVMDSPPKALICLGNAGANSTGPALFFAASGAKYLYAESRNKKGAHQGYPIDFFMNKHCWAKNNGYQYYLWFGEPDGVFPKRDADAAPCDDGKPGNHYFIIAGMHQILKEKPNSWFLSMDISDTFFTEAMAHRGDLLPKFLDDNYDFIGGATNGGTNIFINGGIVAYRKSKWATDFAAEWFKNRCGEMNQIAMWNALFRIWKRDHNPDFNWDKHRMSYYSRGSAGGASDGAKTYARFQSAKMLTSKEDLEAMEQWNKDGHLTKPLHYPHVKVLANIGSGGVEGVAFRADIGHTAEPFVCHNTIDRHTFETCYAAKSMCAKPEQCTC